MIGTYVGIWGRLHDRSTKATAMRIALIAACLASFAGLAAAPGPQGETPSAGRAGRFIKDRRRAGEKIAKSWASAQRRFGPGRQHPASFGRQAAKCGPKPRLRLTPPSTPHAHATYLSVR